MVYQILMHGVISLPDGTIYVKSFKTVWTKIRPDKMLGLILMETVLHSDGSFKRFLFEIVNFDKIHGKFPSMQKVKSVEIKVMQEICVPDGYDNLHL